MRFPVGPAGLASIPNDDDGPGYGRGGTANCLRGSCYIHFVRRQCLHIFNRRNGYTRESRLVDYLILGFSKTN